MSEFVPTPKQKREHRLKDMEMDFECELYELRLRKLRRIEQIEAQFIEETAALPHPNARPSWWPD